MDAQSFFGGRATVKSLLVTDTPTTRTEIVARLQSPRGEMAVLTDGTIPLRHLSYLEFRPEVFRGNHFHKLRHEYFYLIQGELTLLMADLNSGERASVQMHAGDLAYITPGIAHVLKTSTAGHAIEYAAEPFDLSDVYLHPLL